MRELRAFVVLAIAIASTLFFASEASAKTVHCSHQHEYCRGTAYYDAIYGWNNGNEIEAFTGRDDVWAYPGEDWVWGGGDGDNLNGGDAGDKIWGETGNDSYIAIGGNSGIFGGQGPDRLRGNKGNDYVEGGAGQDMMFGGQHNDWFYAEDGQADVVDGGVSTNWEPCYVDGHDSWSSCQSH